MITIEDYLDALLTLQRRMTEAVRDLDLQWIDSIHHEYEVNLAGLREAAAKAGAR